MAAINGIKGFSKSTGEKLLIAAYGNDFVSLSTGKGYSQNLNTNQDVEMDVFLDHLFFQNYTNTPKAFNGTAWTRTNTAKVPLAKYIKVWSDRIYIAYIKIGTQEFPSRVWFTDLPKNNQVQWGYERGVNLSTIADNTLVTSANAGFSAFGIKRGDPFFIIDGSDAGEYTVDTVASDQHIILTEAMTATASSLTYWVGGNWFDVRRDDNDYITGLGENNNQLLVFKQDSLHRYDSVSVRRIRGAFGTTSPRSVVNVGDFTIYFHGSFGTQTGFYAYDGQKSFKVSSPVENHIAGMSGGNYVKVVAWAEGELYRAFIGDIDNSNYNISTDKVVFTYNTTSNTCSIDPIADNIKCATKFRQAGEEGIYLGTDDDEVLKTPSGNNFNGSDIAWAVNTKPYFPAGEEMLCTFPRLQVISQDAEGVKVLYKRIYKPFDSDDNWQGLGEIKHERTELTLPTDANQSSGIKFRFQDTDQRENTIIIKKLGIFYKPETTTIIQ